MIRHNRLAKGKMFAIIREGYGKKSPDPIDKKFKENINGTKNTGISVGELYGRCFTIKKFKKW